MEFIKALAGREQLAMSNYTESSHKKITFRRFEPFEVNSEISLSIQASYAHDCTPQLTLDDLNVYTHWEIALMTDLGFKTVSEVLPDFSSLAEIELYKKSHYSFVPTDLVEELYLALK